MYLERFPGGGARMPVSSGGGTEARWSPDSHTLYYLSNGLMAVDVSAAPSIGRPRTISTAPFVTSSNGVTAYGIGRDGRFLRVQSVHPSRSETAIQLVLNWGEELRALVAKPPR